MPTRRMGNMLGAASAVVFGMGVLCAQAQERELKVGYMKNPIQDASLDMMEKWAKAHGVKLTRVAMAYSVFMEKTTATLTSGTDQFDVIWHNDDWGQLWEKYLETTDDVKGMENVDQWPLLAFWNHEHKLTVVPMAHTVGTFFYRTDLLKPLQIVGEVIAFDLSSGSLRETDCRTPRASLIFVQITRIESGRLVPDFRRSNVRQ